MALIGVLLLLFGVAGLSVFGACVWLPLALVPVSVAAVLAGLLIDWEALRGKSDPPSPR